MYPSKVSPAMWWLPASMPFSRMLMKPIVIVMDQASIHTGQRVWDRRDEWAQRGVYQIELPVASPELNLIEIVWRFMKYEWIDLDAYESWQSLKDHVEKILTGFGEDFVINFA